VLNNFVKKLIFTLLKMYLYIMKKIIIGMLLFFMASANAFSFRFHLTPQYTKKVSFGFPGWVSGSWTVPSGVSRIKIAVFGGGGGGASCWSIGAGCSGGAAGSYVVKSFFVNAGDTVTVATLGSGGSAVSSCYATGSCNAIYRSGGAGTATTVTITGQSPIVASGGAGGLANTDATNKPANWITFGTDLDNFKLGTKNGTSIMDYTTNPNYISYAGSTIYPTATYSGGQAGFSGNGGAAMFMTQPNNGGMGIISSTSGIVSSGLDAAANTGGGGGASVGTTTGGNNGTNSGNGGSGGAIILY
jgi:hypothetical protein